MTRNESAPTALSMAMNFLLPFTSARMRSRATYRAIRDACRRHLPSSAPAKRHNRGRGRARGARTKYRRG